MQNDHLSPSRTCKLFSGQKTMGYTSICKKRKKAIKNSVNGDVRRVIMEGEAILHFSRTRKDSLQVKINQFKYDVMLNR